MPLIFSIEDEIHSYTPLLIKKASNSAPILFFAGDSHVEYLSRITSDRSSQAHVHSYAIWLGPKTLTGIYFDGSSKTQTSKIIDYIATVNTNPRNEIKSLCAISMGNIDIRCFFHQAMIFKIVENESELIDVFTKAAENFLLQAAEALNEHFPHMKFGVLEVLYCNNDEGYSGDDRKIIRRLLKTDLFPTLGSIEHRINWTKLVNIELRKICNNNNFMFVETNKFLGVSNIAKVLNSSDSIDGIHLTNLSAISEIQTNIRYELSNGHVK